MYSALKGRVIRKHNGTIARLRSGISSRVQAAADGARSLKPAFHDILSTHLGVKDQEGV